ncbi:HIT family protein [Thauera linaloolentis]|uniref:Histidine triad (HIT) protein n=1 Tax=Thauera linaloolentis (strain DSM 12138 / JCM 21573 / CCUG 41526 / CIP 105981 / IAM 15112 / NBRC 102519 / 47Lol) TaxID=1123367 RepID=N6Y3N2_THAL4|nr:HIT family protein [Thauera linaloolentis]ENO86195.1 histidine triad (HIT) protein [Thauera linaloolentis 47Lol = DSM 12138]MCM8567243.1 HIT family protein [Thauera linaloolentis]
MDCPLCLASAEHVVWEDGRCRVIRVDDEAHPGFCRVIWNEHVAEMSDLLPADRRHLLDVVLATEGALRALLHPDKINLASFGNMVPHLHWHVIPRYRDDRHFPESVWGQAQRQGVIHPGADSVALARAIDSALATGY